MSFKLAAGLMQLGAALFLLPVFVLFGLRTGALLPLMPWGAGIALLGIIIGLGSRGK